MAKKKRRRLSKNANLGFKKIRAANGGKLDKVLRTNMQTFTNVAIGLPLVSAAATAIRSA